MLLDCFRPGTCERLGIGPDDCAAVNPRLIFARITGWGQDGPLAPDRRPRHQLPVADRRAVGARLPRPATDAAAEPGRRLRRRLDVRAARHRRRPLRAGAIGRAARSIDAAMVDGVSLLAQMMWTMKSTGALRDERESFLLDGGAPFYRCYETADGKYMAVGAIEPQFFAALLAGLGLSADEVPSQFEIGSYPTMFEVFTAAVRQQDPRRVGGDLRRHRRVRHAGADVERSRHRSAPDRALDGGQRRRRRPGSACAAVLPHTAGAGRADTAGNHTARRNRLVIKRN